MPDPETRAYSAYGLTVAMPLPCPELIPSKGNPDICVSFGSLPLSLPGATYKGPHFEIASHTVLLKVEDELRIMITNGNRILIDTNSRAREDEIRVHLLGPAMAAALHQRGMLLLHASCSKIKDLCVAFIGDKGVGKSTLAAAFHDKGNPIFSDDICVIHLSHDGKPIVSPGYPQLKLCDDVLGRLHADASGFRRMSAEGNKCAVPLRHGFHSDPAPLDRIYLLESHGGRSIELTTLTGRARMETLMRYTYRKRMAHRMGKGREQFNLCGRVAEAVPIRRVRRPSTSFLLNELVAMIENDLDGK